MVATCSAPCDDGSAALRGCGSSRSGCGGALRPSRHRRPASSGGPPSGRDADRGMGTLHVRTSRFLTNRLKQAHREPAIGIRHSALAGALLRHLSTRRTATINQLFSSRPSFRTGVGTSARRSLQSDTWLAPAEIHIQGDPTHLRHAMAPTFRFFLMPRPSGSNRTLRGRRHSRLRVLKPFHVLPTR